MTADLSRAAAPDAGSIVATPFGELPDGRHVELYRLRNRHGMQASIMTYGGIITSLTARDRQGRYDDVVLGHDSLAGYLPNPPYFGALVGRYGNRIAKGRFTLDGRSYQLTLNDGPNSLHGGRHGFDQALWHVEEARAIPGGATLRLSYLSRDGEEGYPGTLRVSATYTLSEDDTLRLEFEAHTDRATVLNLTAHSYFNLRGAELRGNVLDHVVTIPAARFLPVDGTLIPTGERRAVAGSPFDFRTGRAIGAQIGDVDDQLRYAKGYDHTFVLDTPSGGLQRAASVYEPQSGRVLEVLSTQPGLQFYSGNQLDGSQAGKGGWRYARNDGFCLEPQHFPDSPNQADFPSTVLRPGEEYRQTILYRFTSR